RRRPRKSWPGRVPNALRAEPPAQCRRCPRPTVEKEKTLVPWEEPGPGNCAHGRREPDWNQFPRFWKGQRGRSLNFGRLRPPLRFGNVNHGERHAVPGSAAATDVPGDVQLVALWTHRGTVRSPRRAAVFVLAEGVQESDHFLLLGPHVELHD